MVANNEMKLFFLQKNGFLFGLNEFAIIFSSFYDMLLYVRLCGVRWWGSAVEWCEWKTVLFFWSASPIVSLSRNSISHMGSILCLVLHSAFAKRMCHHMALFIKFCLPLQFPLKLTRNDCIWVFCFNWNLKRVKKAEDKKNDICTMANEQQQPGALVKIVHTQKKDKQETPF